MRSKIQDLTSAVLYVEDVQVVKSLMSLLLALNCKVKGSVKTVS